ncbi:hypothetical protein BH23PAT1_BH23PAT1_4070 [soil metagenome]
MRSHPSLEPDFHAIFDAVPGLYLILMPDFTIVAASDAYLKATHTVRSKIIGKRLFEVFPDNPKDPKADGVKHLTASLNSVLMKNAPSIMPIQKYDIPRPGKKGGDFEERYWSPLNSPVLSARAEVEFIIHSVVDVTKFVKLKQIEEKKTKISKQLKEQNRLIQAEVRQSEREAEEQKKHEEELIKLDKIKSDFITVASHQLRTPLTAIKWVSEALINKRGKMTKAQQEHYLQQIYDSNERMVELVGALIDVSNIDLGTFSANPRPVRLASILDRVTEDVSKKLEDKEIILTRNIGKHLPVIFIDPSWVRVILHNLIVNSINYSNRGQKITVKIRKQTAGVLIKVIDSGHGIPANQQDNVFTKFFRADNAVSQENDGSGLGLYISKALIEQAGGKIWFDSVEGRGTTFYVKLPLKTLKPVNSKGKHNE